MGKRNYVEILSVRTPAGIENNYQDIVGMVLPITGNAYHGIRVVTPNGTERDIFHYNTKINPKRTTYLKENDMKEANQIDLIAKGLGNGSFIAGYDSMDRLLEFVEASLHGGGNANLIVAMTIATCKNLIDEKLEGERYE